MAKRFILFFSMLAAVAAADTASARTNWQGQVMFTAVTSPACPADGWNVGTHFTSTFLPRNIDNNGPNSFIAFYAPRNAYSYGVANGDLATGANYDAVGISSAGSNFPFSGKIVSFAMKPATLAIDTRFITVTGKISNWAGTLGCTVTFDGAYVLRR